ncbi:MAG: hypothetical protein HXY20_02425 [Acidobacteria bacterium]|nr:hypothetical protein [Acidobacteriota bacterium]
MLILTDSPCETTRLLPEVCRGKPWNRQDVREHADEGLWQTLGPGSAAYSLESTGTSAAERFWSRLVLVAEAPCSQFDLLLGRLAGQVREAGPVACLALQGRGFHGNRGRSWAALAGNLHLTAAIAPHLPTAPYALSMSMLPAVAVVDALTATRCSVPGLGIKWVNDILIEGSKVAGVLTATRVSGEMLGLVVFGIGINVAVAPEVPPTPFVPAVTCLRDIVKGDPPALSLLLWSLLDALATRFDALRRQGTAGLFETYRRLSVVIGRRVRIWDEDAVFGQDPAEWPPARVSGVVLDLGPDLCLRLDGQTDPVCRGRLAFEEACRDLGL